MCTSTETLTKTESSLVRLRAVIAHSHSSMEAALRHLSRPTLPRPPHPAPTFVTMANAPHEEQDTADKPVFWVK